jgi:tetratricopeptide (TPR) repeat protein
MHHRLLSGLLITVVYPASASGQTSSPERVQVNPPTVRRAEIPAANATAESLEQRGDSLKADKAFLDALDFYRAALKKKPDSASVYNKAGITELMLQRFREAAKDFRRAVKIDKKFADAYNNLGVIYYLQKKYGKAVKQYEKAINLRSDAASFYSNLGSAYFSKKEFDKAILAYNQAVKLEPDIFERTSRNGVTAHMSSPEDRAHFDYVLAKLFAREGNADRSLQYLRKAMEDGYKAIDDVYKDNEFAALRKDPRFTELMSARPPAIPE